MLPIEEHTIERAHISRKDICLAFERVPAHVPLIVCVCDDKRRDETYDCAEKQQEYFGVVRIRHAFRALLLAAHRAFIISEIFFRPAGVKSPIFFAGLKGPGISPAAFLL